MRHSRGHARRPKECRGRRRQRTVPDTRWTSSRRHPGTPDSTTSSMPPVWKRGCPPRLAGHSPWRRTSPSPNPLAHSPTDATLCRFAGSQSCRVQIAFAEDIAIRMPGRSVSAVVVPRRYDAGCAPREGQARPQGFKYLNACLRFLDCRSAAIHTYPAHDSVRRGLFRHGQR